MEEFYGEYSVALLSSCLWSCLKLTNETVFLWEQEKWWFWYLLLILPAADVWKLTLTSVHLLIYGCYYLEDLGLNITYNLLDFFFYNLVDYIFFYTTTYKATMNQRQILVQFVYIALFCKIAYASYCVC